MNFHLILKKNITKKNKDKRHRRSSWHTKLERRRRKGMTTSLEDDDENCDETNGGVGFNRQKRHSWWNIFVPDMKQR